MNKFISNILKESEESIDDFFKPKNLKSREEKLEKGRQKYVNKLKSGLSRIKSDYENENYHSEFEELFLEIFSQLHVDEKYDEIQNGYFLVNTHNKSMCLLDLEWNLFEISTKHIWDVFENKFELHYLNVQTSMKEMFDKYFNLDEFTITTAFFDTL